MTPDTDSEMSWSEIQDASVERRGIRETLALLHPRSLALRHKLGVLGVVALALLPLGLTPSKMIGAIAVLYFMMFAISWDLVSGYTGQLSLGHTMFFGTGAYAVTILNVQHGLHPIPSFLIAVVAAGILGILVGLPALRLRGPYLSIVTLVVPLVMLQLVTVFSQRLPILAPDGLAGDAGFIEEPASFFGIYDSAVVTVGSIQSLVIWEFYLAFFLLLVVGGVALAITRSSTGTIFTAIRENESTVAAVGLNPAKYKLFAFTMSAILAGVAGAGFTLSPAGHASPQQVLVLRLSLQVIVMVVLGGIGTIVGAALGVLFFGLFNEVLSAIPLTVPVVDISVGNFEPVPAFVLALLILLYKPDGMLPTLIEWGRRVQAVVLGGEPGPTGAESGSSPIESIVDTYREFFRRYLE